VSKEPTSKIPDQRCAACGYRFEYTTAAQLGQTRPTEGCVSVCAACGHLAVFGADLRLREPTPAERADMETNPLILKAQIYRASIIGDRLKPKRPRR
jgi:ribosomal protein L37E